MGVSQPQMLPQSRKMTKIISKEERRTHINRLKEALDAEMLLNALGFQIYRNTSNELRGPCKIHGGDNKTAFRMNKETKNWVCFSHGCHEEIGYDVLSLVMRVLGISFRDAVTYLENLTGINASDEAAMIAYKRQKERQEFISHTKDNRQVPSALLTEDYLKSFRKFRSRYFIEQGFSEEVLDYFEIGGGYVDKYGFQRDVIPIRDVDGVLKAFSCRDITGKADEDYKYLLTKGFNKDKVLYNLHKVRDISKSIIVVEGFKAVWQLHAAGYKNAVACMGSRITGGQQNLLYSYAFKVVILLDADTAGVKGTMRAVEEMKDKINVRPVFIPFEGKDPGDLTVEEIRELLGGNDG